MITLSANASFCCSDHSAPLRCNNSSHWAQANVVFLLKHISEKQNVGVGFFPV